MTPIAVAVRRASETWQAWIGIGARRSSASPATPPGMRIRTGRFGGLRLACQGRNSQLFEEIVWQRLVERHRGVVPPAPAVGGNSSGNVVRHAASKQLAEDDLASFPVLELHRPEAVTDPAIDVGKDA